MLIWAAIPFYLCAVVAAAAAASVVPRPHARRDRTAWLGLAALFGLMIVVRLTDGENVLRDALRHVLSSEDLYDRRRALQAPIIAVAALVMAIPAFLELRRLFKVRRGPPRWVSLARLAGLAYMCLFAARLVSLHQLDALLYNGPHLNRIIDPSLALFVAWMAWRYRRDLVGRLQTKSAGQHRR